MVLRRSEKQLRFLSDRLTRKGHPAFFSGTPSGGLFALIRLAPQTLDFAYGFLATRGYNDQDENSPAPCSCGSPVEPPGLGGSLLGEDSTLPDR